MQNFLHGRAGKNSKTDKNERYTLDETLELCKRLGGITEYTLDVAACEEAHVCQVWISKEENGLIQNWHGDVWCNPPWEDLSPWLEKAWQQWAIGEVRSISMLLPATRTEQPWWQECVEPFRDCGDGFETYFLPKRIKFKGFKGSPPFTCVLLVWKR